MRHLTIPATVAAALAFAPQPGFADPKPQGTKRAAAQQVANAYAGKTQTWKSCKGGIYYGAKWQAQAFCDKKGPSVGLGTWSVKSDGSVCHTLTWYWPNGDGYGSKSSPAECVKHVAAQDGQVWRNFSNEADWWRLNPDSLSKGFKMKGKVNRLRRKLGV